MEEKPLTYETLKRLTPEERKRLDAWLALRGITFRAFKAYLKEIDSCPVAARPNWRL